MDFTRYYDFGVFQHLEDNIFAILPKIWHPSARNGRVPPSLGLNAEGDKTPTVPTICETAA